jgi:hypothetical protein
MFIRMTVILGGSKVSVAQGNKAPLTLVETTAIGKMIVEAKL